MISGSSPDPHPRPLPDPTTPAPTLTGPDGVRLRAHRPDDVAGVLEQALDPLSQAQTTVPVPYLLEHAHEFVHEVLPAGWASGSDWAFAIEADGRFAGTVSLRDEGDGRAEIAYGAHPWVRGTGRVEAALRLLLDWGFAEHDLHTVVWLANRGNWASRKLAWRLGFSFDGTLRQWLPQRGELLDAWTGTLLRDDPREPRTTWLDCPVVEGGSVRLRPWRADDAARVVEAGADERTAYWLGNLPAPYTLADAEAYLEARTEGLATGTTISWAVADRASDVVLGSLTLFDLRAGVDAEIGYWVHPEARGRGVMTEATGLALDHAMRPGGALGLTRVRIAAAADNRASRHVIEAQGARLVGVETGAVRCRDGMHDHAVYEVLASDRTGRSSEAR